MARLNNHLAIMHDIHYPSSPQHNQCGVYHVLVKPLLSFHKVDHILSRKHVQNSLNTKRNCKTVRLCSVVAERCGVLAASAAVQIAVAVAGGSGSGWWRTKLSSGFISSVRCAVRVMLQR